MLKMDPRPRKWLLSLSIVFLMIFTAFIGVAGSAQDNNTSENENVETNGTIVGIVTDIEANPLAGAIVYLTKSEEIKNSENPVYKVQTNERGYFEFSELERGLYYLKVYLDGYKEWNQEVKVPAGETIKLEVKLEKLDSNDNQDENTEPAYSNIIGHVFNALDNTPIAGAIVTINQIDTERKLQLETNERGMFEVKLPRGKYVIVVEARGFWPFKEELAVPGLDEHRLKIPLKPREVDDEVNRPTLCGHIFDAETDKPIFGWVELTQGSPEIPEPNYNKNILYNEMEGKTRQAESDKQIVEEELNEPLYGKVIGYVFNGAEDKVIAGALVIIYHMENERKLQLETNERGLFEVKLPRGKYVLYVEARGFLPYKEELIVKGNDTQKLKIPLRPGDYNENPKRPEKPEDYKLWRTFTNREGWYEYFNVPTGHYEIRAFANGHVMFYNEIDIKEDSHIYLDIYLLREPCPPIQEPRPEPKPVLTSIIGGHVFNARTKDPVAGAIVCVIPLNLIRERLNNANLNLEDLKLENLREIIPLLIESGIDVDLNNVNVEFNQDIEVVYKDMEPKELDKDPNVRGSEPVNPDGSIELIEPPIPPEPEVEGQRQITKFCTKTDEEGNFKLKIPAGQYILLVKARAYNLFAYKFAIRPNQQLWVRVPLKPMLDTNYDKYLLSKDENDSNNQRPGSSGNTNTDTTSSSETAKVGNSVPITTSGAGPILSATLGLLFLIIVILGTFLFHKNNYRNSLQGRKKRVLKH